MINKDKSGLTLIELMVSMVVGAIIINALLTIQSAVSTAQNTLTTGSIALTDANAAIQAMTSELRNAKQAANGSYPMSLADDDQIIFFSNIDDDPDIEKIRYFIFDHSLNKGVVNPVGNPPQYNEIENITLVIPNVVTTSTPTFRYYNGDWPQDTVNNPLPSPARLIDTKFVTVSISINPNASTPNSEYYLESSAQIRSVKTN